MAQIDVSEMLMDDLQEAKRDGESDEALLRTMLSQYEAEKDSPGYEDLETPWTMYWKQGLIQAEMASEFEVDEATINDNMKKHGIRPQDLGIKGPNQ